MYSSDDLIAYGTNRWKRVGALADEFERHWREYIYEVGNSRDKWNVARRNAQIGDLVLIAEKNLPRLKWSTGTIVDTEPDRKDGLVRRVTVQPHSPKSSRSPRKPLKRAIHNLVLLKELTARNPEGEEMNLSSLKNTEDPLVANEVLNTMSPSIPEADFDLRELFQTPIQA